MQLFAEDFKETVAGALQGSPSTPGKALAAAKEFIEPRLSNELRNLLRARGATAHPVARGRCKRALDDVRSALRTLPSVSSDTDSLEVGCDSSTRASLVDCISSDIVCSRISKDGTVGSGGSDFLGDRDSASPETFFFGDTSVDVASQTVLSLPDASLTCSCGASPQEAIEPAPPSTAIGGASASFTFLLLKVRNQEQGNEVQFKIKRTRPLGQLFSAFCERIATHESKVRFTIDGERPEPFDTCAVLGLEDDDIIDAHVCRS